MFKIGEILNRSIVIEKRKVFVNFLIDVEKEHFTGANNYSVLKREMRAGC